MHKTHNMASILTKVFLLAALVCVGVTTHVHASDVDQAAVAEEIKAARAKVADAQAEKEQAVKARDALAAQQASKPNPDTERKLKDADYEVMMADSKLSSATKAVERAQKKLNESPTDVKSTPASLPTVPAAKVEKPVVTATVAPAVPVVNEASKKAAAEEQARKEAEAKLAAQKASEEAAQKAAQAEAAAKKQAQAAAAELARKEAEAKAAAQKASEEAAQRAAQAEAAAKKQALAAELGIDKNCVALPSAPTNPSAAVDEADQAYAQGFLKQVNQLVAKRTMDDVPPISPFPVLEGSKLNPCDPDQKLALKFGYLGNGQYRLETPVLAGEQEFVIKNVVQPLNRTIPDSDNGEVYVFFLDGREGRTKLSAYKKSLLVQSPQ